MVESKNNDDDVLACSNEKLGDPKGFEDPFTSAEMDETAVNGQDDVSIASTLKVGECEFYIISFIYLLTHSLTHYSLIHSLFTHLNISHSLFAHSLTIHSLLADYRLTVR